MTEARRTRRADVDLLRQLASAVASYRLFPGDPDQPGFQAAVERVQNATGPALVGGPLHVDIRSGQFETAHGPVEGDEVLQRFAVLCFERQVEHLHVVRAPTDRDLVALGEALSATPEELRESGGPGAHLRTRGVTSIVLGAVSPEGTEDAGLDGLDDLTPDQLALWQKLQDPEGLAASLIIEGLPQDPATAAQDVYVRFRALHAVLPERVKARKDLFVQIRKVLDNLPEAVGREFVATVMTRLAQDTFASDHAISLTDSELADVLVDLARHGGPDPVELGRRIAHMTDRKEQLLGLIEARMERTPDMRELVKGVRPTMLALSKGEDETQVRQAVADALAEGLLSVSSEDATALRGLYPATDEDDRTLALLALRDYLRTETSRASLQRVLDVWTVAARQALARLDGDEIDRLLDVLQDPKAEQHDVFSRDAIDRAIASVPNPASLRELVERTATDVPVDEVQVVLRRFGGSALDAILDLLSVEEDRTVRAQLVGLASELADLDPGRVAQRLDDPRWYVVRNIATILGRTGGSGALQPLVTLSKHGDPAVRREAVRGLVKTSGSDAVPYLRRLADDRDASVRTAALGSLSGFTSDVSARALADLVRNGDHRDDRHKALDALGSHASPERRELLANLASRREKPRLPRDLRRKAKKMHRALGKSS